MTLVRIDGASLPRPPAKSWDIGEDVVTRSFRLSDFAGEASRLKERSAALRRVGVEDLLGFFDAARGVLAVPSAESERSFPGVAYLSYFLAKRSLESLLDTGLRGSGRFLDGFRPFGDAGKRLAAVPRGLITHWLAGNVPALGLISLVQGILTKNANVVKLPCRDGLGLPVLFKRFCEFRPGGGVGRMKPAAIARAIEAAVLFVYCEPGDVAGHRALSEESDVRIAWGGAEAVSAVGQLPRRPGAEDVVFGPRFSLAVVGREQLTADSLEGLADRLATDASVFDQRGCNSAQAVFVEKGGTISPRDFAAALAVAMDKALRRIPKQQADAAEAYAVASIRAEHAFAGEVFASPGTEWTVVYSEDASPLRPCGSRVVFVRPVDDVMSATACLTSEIQTIGLSLDEPRRTAFAAAAAERGVSRIVPAGTMSLYDTPWDGVFPVDRLVRWVSLG